MMSYKIEDYIKRALSFYGKIDSVKLVLRTGSSLNKDLYEVLDIDLIFFVTNQADDGTFYLDVNDARIECIVIPIEKIPEVIIRSLRSQQISLIDMIKNSELVFGEKELLDSIREKIDSIMVGAKAIFIPEPAGFAASGLVKALTKATTITDMTALAFAILEFISKTEGPLRGGWPMSPKYLLRLLEKEEGASENSLLYAIQKCTQGEKKFLINYMHDWIRQKNLPQLDSFCMFRPPVM